MPDSGGHLMLTARPLSSVLQTMRLDGLVPARFLSVMSHLTLTLTLLIARVSLPTPDSSSVSCLG